MTSANSALRQDISKAFLAHRLNNSELVSVTQSLKGSEAQNEPLQATKDLLQELSRPEVDQRQTVTLEAVQQAIDSLELNATLANLSSDQPWTPYERAVYRRLSCLQNDPLPKASLPQAQGNPALQTVVAKVFTQWDQNHDGFLSPLELDNVMTQASLTAEEAAAAVILRSQSQALATCVSKSNQGVTMADLKYFSEQGLPDNANTTFKINAGFLSACKAAANLEPVGNLMSEDFDPMQVKQGQAGSCVLLATQASLSSSQIKSMFEPLEDGTINVHFADGETENVHDLSATERLYHAKTLQGGRWPGLMELALGQRIARHSPKADGSVRSAANGISPNEASQAIHGHSIAKVSLDKISLQQTRDMLISLMDSPKPWIAGSRTTVKGQEAAISLETLYNGIHNRHAYSIQSFDPQSDTIKLRNPWHRGEWVVKPDGCDDGIFAMPLKDFYASYRWVSIPASATVAKIAP